MFDIALALTLAAAAEPPAPQTAQSSERICRGGGQRALGTRTRTRPRCLTAEQWQREEEERNRPAPGVLITEGQNDGRTTATPR